MDEIVRRLRSRSFDSLKALKESMPVEGLKEADEEEEELTSEEEEATRSLQSRFNGSDVDSETTDDEIEGTGEGEDSDEELTPDNSLPTEEENKNPNPLDNPYAANYRLGQEVIMTYSDGDKTRLSGTIEGYDKEGFYRVKWSNGKTTNGITDIALTELVGSTTESTCVCGADKFVNENNKVVCDKCGRLIRESVGTSKRERIRPKLKSISTANKSDIREAIKSALKKPIKEVYDEEDYEEEDDYSDSKKLPRDFSPLAELKGEFWTRLSELVADIKELGYEVLESNNEYVLVVQPDSDSDTQLYIPIGGTSRTMTLDFDRVRVY